MPQRDTERLADALWRTFRPNVVQALGAALANQEEPDLDSELDPEVEARAAEWAARKRQRDRERQRLLTPAKRPRAAARRKASP